MMSERRARHRLGRVAGAFLLTLTMLQVGVDGGFRGSDADAALIQSFTPPAYTTNTTGAIDIIGNGLMTCGTSTNCINTLNGTRNSGNGSFTMIDLDADDGVLTAAQSGQTTNSSMAVYAPPAGSTVLYASLHWSANSNSSARNRLSLLPPGATNYQTITGTVANLGSLYQTSADITSIVQAAGPGDYWAGNIQRTQGGGQYAGWSMVVVYENGGLPVRNLTVFDGFGRVTSQTNDNVLDVPISGFLTPPLGAVNAEIGIVAYEGDRNITGDQVLIDTNPGPVTTFANLTDASNPTTNFGNGTITDAGIPTATGLPVDVNNLNVDIDEFATVNTLANSQTDTTIRFQTVGDWWYPGVLTTAIDLFVPQFPEVNKTVVDLNGGDAVPGDVLEYDVVFENTGNDFADNSVVSDVIPAGTTYVPGSIQIGGVAKSDTPGNDEAEFTGSEVVARVGTGATPLFGGTIAPGDSVEVSFQVTIDDAASGTTIENVATLDYRARTIGQDFQFDSNQVDTPVPPRARLSVTKSGSPDPVVAGENVTWTIEVANAGPNTATGVTLDDVLVGNTFVSVSGATCAGASAGDTTLGCTLADIPAGSSSTVTLVAATDPALAPGSSASDTVTVDAAQDDDDLSDNSASAQVAIDTEADLTIVKADVADPVAAGATVDYTLTVTNAGPSDAADVVISDQTDGQFAVTSVSLAGGVAGTCSVATRSCALDDPLAPGDSVTMNVSATVDGDASATIENRGTVTSSTTDPTPGDNTDLETTTVTPVADVSVVKTTVDAPVVAGEQVTYSIVVSNAGPSAAANVTLSDPLPAGLSFVSAATTQGACPGTGPVTCNFGSIGAGGSVTVTVVADVADTATGAALANTATVASPTDTTPGNNESTANDTVLNSADLRLNKEIDESTLAAGAAYTYTLTTINDGPSETSGTVTVTDTIPVVLGTPTAAAGSGWTCNISGQDVTCTRTTPIPVGGTAPLTISGTAPAGSPPGLAVNDASVSYPTDPDPANNDADATTELALEADVRIDKEWTTATATAGGPATFTLVVTNSGPSIAPDVSITDVLPGGMTVTDASGTGVSCNPPGTGSVSCSADLPMAPGASLTITVDVDVPADLAAGQLNNTATVASTANDRNPSNNTDVDGIDIVRLADLGVTKVATDTSPVAGESVEFTVVVTNDGPSTANATFVGDALPVGMTLSTFPSPLCSDNAGSLSCDLGVVQPGAANAVTIVYTAVIDPSVADGTPLTNTATASSPDPDPTPATVDEVVTVAAEADLIVTKTASADPATPGGTLTYTITVDNDGPSDAQGVTIADPPPVGFTPTSAASTIGSCDLTVDCTIGTLEAGATAVITITGDVASGITGNLTNTTGAVASTTTLINTGDDVGTVTVATAPAADLQISKSASPTTIAAGGGNVTFVVAVSNNGPSDAMSTVVTDSLPAGFVVDSVTPSQGSCSSDTSCELGTVVAGAAPATITYVGYFPSTAAAGTVTNEATVTSPTDPGGPSVATADVAITTSADVSVAKSGPVTVNAGDAVQYNIAVQNAGPSVAEAVTLTDVLDAAQLDAANATVTPSPACANNSGTIDCSFGDLPVGALITVVVQVDALPDATVGAAALSNTATIDSATADPTPANDTSSASTDVTRESDVAVVKSGPTGFVAGETGTYTLSITNNGPSDAVATDVDDVAPAGVTFGAVAGTAGCVALPCSIASIAAGDTVTVTIDATVGADSDIASIENTATVSNADDKTPGNDSSTITTPVTRDADMRIVSKDSAPDPVSAGATITYTIVVANDGPSTARNAELTDTVPVNTTLVPSSLPLGCSFTGVAAGETITCDLGLMTAGQNETISFDVIVDPATPDGTVIENTATAGSDTPDGTPGNDSNPPETTLVAVVADVGITKTADLATAVPGEPLTYTLTVVNAGPSSASTVVIDDDISSIFEPGSVSTALVGAPGGVACDATVNCTLADFPVGTFDVEITGTVLADATADLANSATISTTSNQGADVLGNSDDLDTPVAPSADLSIAKSASPDPVEPGEPITYTITVSNAGPSDAVNVEVTDLVPAELTIDEVRPLAQCNQATAVCLVPAIAAGGSATIEIDGTVATSAVDTIENTATITATDTPDPVAGNDSTTIETDVVPEADIQVTKTTITDPVVAGTTVRYAVVIVNNGPAPAENVDVVDLLPANATFVNASTPVGTCTKTGPALGGTLTCELGTLGATTSIQIDVDVIVEPDASGTLDNSVTATSTTDDPDATNNDATNPNGATSDPMVTAPDLRVQKSLVSADPADPDLVAGEPFEYLIEIFNDGPSTAVADITLADTLPPEVSDAVPAEVTPRVVTLSGIANPADCTYDDATNQIDCTFSDDLAVGDSIQLTVSGFIRTDALIGVADNTATVTTTDADPNPANSSGTAEATLVTNADLQVAKSFADSSVIAGQDTTFTISVTNNGPSDAADVELTDALPAGFTVLSLANATGGLCSNTATTVTCSNTSLPVGATISVDVTALVDASQPANPVNNTAGVTSTTDDRNPSNNTSTDGITVTRLADLTIAKTSSSPTVVAGNQITYTLTVGNTGPSSAEATVVGDPLDPALTIVEPSITTTQGTCTAPGNVLTCDLGEILPGAAPVQIEYTVTFDPAIVDGTTINNAAQADSITPLTGGPATADTDVDVVRTADVELVSKTVTPDPVIAGETVEYTITARNNGPSISTNTTVIDELPAGLTLEAPLPAGCSDVAGDLSCDLGTLTVGQVETITFTARVDADEPDGSAITNDASISATEPDPNAGNDTASVPVTVDTVAALSITKVAGPDPAVPGESLTYTITVTNDGPSDAASVVVDDTTLSMFQAGTISSSASQGNCDLTVSCAVGTVAPGAANAVTVTITGTVAADLTTDISNTAGVTSPTDPTPDEVTIITPVAPVTDLSITKTLDTSPLVPGGPVQYTITVTNPGPSDAQSVAVVDSIDPAVTGLLVDQAQCQFTGQDLACAVGTLPPGDFVIVVTGVLDEGFTGDLANSATVTTTTDQGANTSPDTASVDETAAPDADLVLTKTAAPDPVIAGELVTYTITVRNDGPSTAIGVQVDDALPAGLTVDDVSSSQGGCTSLPCDLGDLVDGASATVTVVAQVDADVTDLAPNSATTSSTTPDSDLSNNNDTADPVVDTLARLSTTKELSTPTAVPGTRVSWTITVDNDGPSDALDVSVADTVPAVLTGVTVTSSQGACSAFDCLLGTVEPGGSATITIEGDLPADTPAGTLDNVAVTTSTTPDDDLTNDTGTASNPIVPSADVSIEKVGPTSDLVPGQPATFVVTVTNDGPSDAQNVEFTDTVPASIDPATITTNVTSGAATCDPVAGSLVTCRQATLLDGDSYVVEITGTVLADVTDASVDNTAVVTSDTPDPDGSDNSSTSTTDVTASADLSVTKALTTGFTEPIDPSAPISYTITVANAGPSDAQNVVVGDTLPTEITLTAISTAVVGATCDQGAVTCTFPTVAAGTSVEVTVTGTVSDRALGSFDNVATVASDTTDPDPSDNTVTETTDVTPFADLGVAKTLLTPAADVVAGQQVRYQLVVTNDGPAPATLVEVLDTLPAGTVFVSTSTPVGACVHDGSATGGVVDCDLGTLPDQASVTITIDIDIVDDTSGQLANSASVSSPITDPVAANDTSSTSDTIRIVPDLQITKTLVQSELVAGDPFTYQIVVKNNGPSDALAQIDIDDVLPPQVDQALPITADYVISSGGSGSCAVTPGAPSATVDCDITDDLAVGETITVTVAGTVDSGAAAFDDNTATVATGDEDPDLANNSATAESDLATNADLSLVKVFDDDSVVAGDDTVFDLIVSNAGPSDALAVSVTDVLPAGFEIVSAVSADGTCVTSTTNAADDTTTCTMGTIANGASVTITVTADVDPSLGAGPVTNTATVTSSTPDRNPSSNTATDQIAVERFATLDLDKVVVSPTPPADVVAGEEIDYEITVDNAGPSSAEGSVVGDALPAGVTIDVASITASQGSCTTPGGILTCSFGEILPGDDATVTYTVTVDAGFTGTTVTNNASADSPTPNNGPVTDSETVGVDTEADLELVSKIADPTTAVAGSDLEYSILVRNNGPSVARDVLVSDDIPTGLTVLVASLPTGCTLASGDVECELGDLAPTAERTITFTVTVDADQLGPINNTAEVSSNTPEPAVDPSPNTNGVVTPVDTSADLSVVKTADPSPAVPGQPITYTIVVTNAGPSVARAVELTDDDAPSILTGASGTWVNGAASGSCDATINCAIGDLPVGTATITITGTVPADQTTTLVNSATVSTTTDDPDATNDTGSAFTPVAPEADITVTKVIDTTPLVPGEPMQFTITVTNNGPSDAANVLVSDNIDASMTGLATTAPDCSISGQLLGCSIDTLAPGAGNAVSIVVTGDLASSYTGSFSNVVNVSTSTSQGPDAAPNTATATAPAEPDADLSSTKDATPDPVIAGEVVTYLITVSNAGPSDATGVVVTDTLPAGLTAVNVFSSQGACSSLPCSLNTIPDGGSATVTVEALVGSDLLAVGTNTADVTADTPDSTPGNNESTEDVALDTLARLTTVKELSTPTAVPGGPLRWTITVTNAGPSDARDVSVADTVPAAVTNTTISSSQGGCTAFSCLLGTIPAGGSATITIDADLPADVTATSISNTATTTSSTPDDDNTDDSSTATNPIAPAADVRITKVGPTSDVVAGTAVSWTLIVVNDGPSDAADVIVTDDLPAALDPASIVIGDGGATCTLTGLSLSCDLSTMADGATATITIDGTLRTDFTGASLDNVATVASSTADPDTSNNSDSATNDNAPLADIVVTGTVTPTSVPAGTTTGYEFEIVNNGPSDAADTVVTIPIPASMTIVGTPTVVGFPGATVTVVDGVITVDIGDLPPGTPVTITFDGDVSIDQPAGPLPITATGSTATTQNDTSNDAATLSIDVINDVDLSIVKEASAQVVAFGDEVTFTITVTNDGRTPAIGATVTDDLPAGLEATAASSTDGSCTVSADGSQVVCEPLTVAADGGTVTITIVADATGDGTVTNTATLECECIVATITSDPAVVDVDRHADLGVTKTVFRAITKPGFAVTYTITVTNDGPDTAIGTVLREQLPNGLRYVSSSPSVGTYDPGTGVWNIGDLADGATATMDLRVVVLVEGNFINEVTVSSDIEDRSPDNNSAEAVLLAISPDLPLTGTSTIERIVPISIGALVVGLALLLGSRRRSRGDGTLGAT
ncbi:DUF7933 domain-containing protein [Ilumatobacter coccineus]|uniref:DUF7933 domain-containing protein n=1 Tax=Ilumatobacter coccineus TaxID=467094 RepID=UPI0012B69E27|nr:DUF11 domain-containing protein [Ilumatobacter coccineus]